MSKIITSIGLMSGTSADGIDVALIKSDGENIISREKFGYYPYEQEMIDRIKNLASGQSFSPKEIKEIELEITQQHILAVEKFLLENKIKASEVDIIGFHGHTIYHNPQKLITWQIGNAQMLATKTKINVVADFRTKDVIYGGQGAPLVPVYHHALLKNLSKPLVILNIGGVANITYLKNNDENNLIAFDICFGNAPMDDLVKKMIGKNFDVDGNLAKNGKINYELANEFLSAKYFKKDPPKSLDRNEFNDLFTEIYSLKLEDALATLCYILGKAVDIALKKINSEAKEIIVCGGGRNNLFMMKNIAEITKIKTSSIDDLTINGDAVEAEAFAFLAVRNLMNLPISFTKTTGVLLAKHDDQFSAEVNFSSCGGVFYRA